MIVCLFIALNLTVYNDSVYVGLNFENTFNMLIKIWSFNRDRNFFIVWIAQKYFERALRKVQNKRTE